MRAQAAVEGERRSERQRRGNLRRVAIPSVGCAAVTDNAGASTEPESDPARRAGGKIVQGLCADGQHTRGRARRGTGRRIAPSYGGGRPGELELDAGAVRQPDPPFTAPPDSAEVTWRVRERSRVVRGRVEGAEGRVGREERAELEASLAWCRRGNDSTGGDENQKARNGTHQHS